jgi:hypothetical protein
MTRLAALWPDPYGASVLRKYSPGFLAELAAWILALAARLADAFVPVMVTPAPAVVCLTAAVAIPDGPAVVWSAPAGADSMRTGPPCLARETLLGAGRT